MEPILYPNPHQERDRQLVNLLVENLVDLDVVVDDRRADVDRAVEALTTAIEQRVRATQELIAAVHAIKERAA